MMVKAVAINGSPRIEKGYTALVLTYFLQGMNEGGCETGLLYASRMKIKPCTCGVMHCWDDSPGECCIKDDMELLYPKLKATELLILATPVYIPLPGAMQNVINRLCSLIDPKLVRREGRTRARFHQDVNIRKIVLVATSGWWELGNFDTVIRIVSELAADAGVEFGGAVLRPHSSLLKADGKITRDGEAVLDAVRRAGNELAKSGRIKPETLKNISRQLVSEEEYWKSYISVV
jgi:multimeric flavodoxin WrbA